MPSRTSFCDALRRRLRLGPWDVIERVRQQSLTFLSAPALHDLAVAVKDAERDRVPGVLVEAGCALGGSAIVMAAAKGRERRLEVHDVFGMIPPPTERDGPDVTARYETIVRGDAVGIHGDVYYGYRADLLEEVTRNFETFGFALDDSRISLVPGLFEETLRPAGPVAVAHIDGDWYESVAVCLDRIGPHVSVGGRMIIDDYDAWSGCKAAVDDWLKGSVASEFTVERQSRVHLVRKGSS